MLIRPAHQEDHDAIWCILKPVNRAGETYPLPRDMSRAEAIAYWTGRDRETFVAEEDGRLLGTYYLSANQLGGGAHVANCGYMTASDAAGRGVGRQMCEHSLESARRRGFRAMQFNFVVSTNERAIRLWQSLGFKTVGRLPSAFNYPTWLCGRPYHVPHALSRGSCRPYPTTNLTSCIPSSGGPRHRGAALPLRFREPDKKIV